VVAAVVFYYGSTSEVAWLFLLGYWIAAFVAVAYLYARWNWSGLRGRIAVRDATPGPDSPVDLLPDQVLRALPVPVPIFEGDTVEIELGLDTSGAARGPARLTGSVAGAEVGAATGLIPKKGWREHRPIGPVARGPLDAQSWRLEASDPLGLFKGRRTSPDAEVALALPRFTSLVSSRQVREVESSVAAPRAGTGTEVFGVREYRPGDPLRRIHWRSSARHGELIVREYEPPGVQTLGIFCDPAPPNRAVADQIARIAASEAWDCLRDGGRVLLAAPGLEPSRPDESRSLWALLEWLARYPGALSDGDVAPVSDAVAIFGTASSALAEALDTIRLRGGSVRAWVVGEAEADVDGPVTRVGTRWPL